MISNEVKNMTPEQRIALGRKLVDARAIKRHKLQAAWEAWQRCMERGMFSTTIFVDADVEAIEAVLHPAFKARNFRGKKSNVNVLFGGDPQVGDERTLEHAGNILFGNLPDAVTRKRWFKQRGVRVEFIRNEADFLQSVYRVVEVVPIRKR